MRKILFLISVLFGASVASAQDCSTGTPCSVAGNATQVLIFTQARLIVNAGVCAAASLPANCTQAQARAVNPDANVYSDNQDFLTRFVIAPKFVELREAVRRSGNDQFCTAWSFLSVANKNTICTNKGFETGCELCP